MSYARTVMRLMRILNLNEDEYDNLSSSYYIHSLHASNMSFEEYLDREITAGRITRHSIALSGQALSGQALSGHGGDPGSRESGQPSQEATGHSNHGRTLVSPRPREPGHRFQDAGHSIPARSLSGPGPHESGHGSQETGRSNNDRTLVSHPRPRPREDYMHHATGPSHGSRDRRGTSWLGDDVSDESSSDDDTPAGSPSTNTNRFPEDRPLRGHGTDFFCGTGIRYPTDSNDDHADHEYDAHPHGGRSEDIRPPTRRGPTSIAQRRPQSPPPRSVQSPPPTRPDYFAPRGDRVPPSPFALASPLQSLPSMLSSQAYSIEGRSGAGHDAPQSGSQRAPITANGVHFGETYYDPRNGPPPDHRRGGAMRDY
ncbi:MAG: hypothetical protein ASARMPREDX12_008056 [Alectoria sarmentosa]|nr:MAG: hypothetical protein ASARMPREDX12_008056 [Alectoria sarmentosa]